MSYLVAHLEDRFSHDEAHISVDIDGNSISTRYNLFGCVCTHLSDTLSIPGHAG